MADLLTRSVIMALLLLQPAAGKKCYKRDIIADRENNVFYCNNPTYSECCEDDNRFYCCEPSEDVSIYVMSGRTCPIGWRGQAVLWGCVLVAIVVLVVILVCIVRDSRPMKADTVQDLLRGLKQKAMLFRCRKGEGQPAPPASTAPPGPAGPSRPPRQTFLDVFKDYNTRIKRPGVNIFTSD